MKVISINVNGIRAAARKGFFDWLETQDADIVCFQELKAKVGQLTDRVFAPDGYNRYFHEAERPGYSGVAIYSRIEPDDVRIGFGWQEFDAEGRYIQLDFANLSIASIYMPSGSSSTLRQDAKFDLMARMKPVLTEQVASGRSFILCGDWNIAHKKIDICNWRGNQKNSGFLPEERAWMDMLFNELGWVDAFRVANQSPDEYTWWSNRGQAWAKNVGWRIDYQIITPDLRDAVKSVDIYREQRFSDHAPLLIEYEYSLDNPD